MHVSTKRFAETTLGAFAETLASEAPAPGGGSAVAIAAAFGASLTGMVARLSIGRPRYEQHQTLLTEAVGSTDDARDRLLALADEDAAAYTRYLEALRLPRDTPEDELLRASTARDAARTAVDVPLSLVQECHRLVDLAERLAGRSNVSAASDLDVALLLLEAAARGAAANVIANLPATQDEGYSEAVLAEVDERLRQIQGTSARTRERVRKGAPQRSKSA